MVNPKKAFHYATRSIMPRLTLLFINHKYRKDVKLDRGGHCVGVARVVAASGRKKIPHRDSGVVEVIVPATRL